MLQLHHIIHNTEWHFDFFFKLRNDTCLDAHIPSTEWEKKSKSCCFWGWNYIAGQIAASCREYLGSFAVIMMLPGNLLVPMTRLQKVSVPCKEVAWPIDPGETARLSFSQCFFRQRLNDKHECFGIALFLCMCITRTAVGLYRDYRLQGPILILKAQKWE